MNTLWIVFIKEMLESWRDKRTWRAMLIGPVILFVMLGFVPKLASDQVTAQKNTIPLVAVEGSLSSPIAIYLEKTGKVHLTPLQGSAKQAIESKSVQTVLVIPSSAEVALRSGVTVPLSITYDDSNQESSYAQTLVAALLGSMGQAITTERLDARGLPTSIAHPFTTSFQDIATPTKQAALVLSKMLPYLLGIWAVSGGVFAAVDAGAGEKERGTLEPLLMSVRNRSAMVYGKYLSVAVYSLVSSFLSLVAVFASSFVHHGGGSPIRFSMSTPELLLTLLALVCITSYMSALQLAISIFARKFREAQSYLAPLTLLVVIPGVLLQLITSNTIPIWYTVIPIFGAEILIKEAVLGIFDSGHIFVVVGSSVLFTALCAGLATRQFRNERIIFRQ